MPVAPALAKHATGGRVEFVRLALRSGAAGSGGALGGTAAARAGATGWRVAHAGFEVEITVWGEGDRARLRPRVRNLSAEPRRFGSAVLGFVWRAPDTRSLRYLRQGWQSGSESGSHSLDEAAAAVDPAGSEGRGLDHALPAAPAERAGWHESHVVLAVAEVTSGATCLVGAYEDGRSFAVAYARREGSDVRIELELWLDATLESGEQRELERIEVAVGEEVWPLLERFGDAHGSEAGARVWRPAAAGWSSGHHAFHDVCEADVLRALEALSAARDELPIEVVALDDGFQRATGDWLETNARFPRGLAALSSEVRGAGFVPGLWTAPLCAVAESELFRKHPDWFLRQGTAPRVALVQRDGGPEGRVFALDAGRGEVLHHLEEVFRTLAGWGFLHLQLDLLSVAARGESAEPRTGPAARVRSALEAVRRGAGEEVFLLGSGCPLGPAVGVVDGMRICPDAAPRGRLDPNSAPGLPGGGSAPPPIRRVLRSALARAWMHRRLWLNDLGGLTPRSRERGLSPDERQALAVAIAATGGRVAVSGGPAYLPPPERALLRDTFVWSQAADAAGIPGAARVDGVLAREIPQRVVWRDAESVTAGLFNAEEQTKTVAFPEGAGRGSCVLGSRGAQASDGRVAIAPHGGALWRFERAVPLAVFCDFDGTFSVQDVGATLAARFAGDERAVQWIRYERGEITPWQYNLEILDGLPVGAAEVERFLASVELDPGARELLAWARARDVPLRILSDGFDWNLNLLQCLHRVRFSYVANHLRIEGGRWKIRAGAPCPGCGCGTGTCKGGILRAYRAARPDTRLAHIGNGRVSDTCGALAADLVFAKDSLVGELERRGVPFVPFRTLRDVLPYLEGALEPARPTR